MLLRVVRLNQPWNYSGRNEWLRAWRGAALDRTRDATIFVDACGTANFVKQAAPGNDLTRDRLWARE
jgi:hypothetical protein